MLMPSKTVAEMIEAADAYAAWLRSSAGSDLAGRHVLEKSEAKGSEICLHVMHVQRLQIERTEGGAESVTRTASAAVESSRSAGEAIKVIRSDALWLLKYIRRMTWDTVTEVAGIKRARADQVVKGVSGGEYLNQWADRQMARRKLYNLLVVEPERAAEIERRALLGHLGE